MHVDPERAHSDLAILVTPPFSSSPAFTLLVARRLAGMERTSAAGRWKIGNALLHQPMYSRPFCFAVPDPSFSHANAFIKGPHNRNRGTHT